MSECAWLEQITGSPAAQRQPELEKHLDQCASCREARQHAVRISSLRDPDVPSGAWDRLEQGIRRKRKALFGGRLAAAAALLAAVLVPLGLWKAGPPTPRVEVEVLDLQESPDPSVWFSVLTQHAENDAVPVTTPSVEEE